MATKVTVSLLTGTYNHDQITALAMTHFPEAFASIPEWTDVPWEIVDNDRVGFSEHSLFLGHLNIDGVHHKVSAYMTSAGEVQFFRYGMGLSRRDNGNVELASFWQCLSENAVRPELLRLKALYGYYFLAAGHIDVIHAHAGWLRALDMACTAVGEGIAEEDGMDGEKISGIVQRLLGNARVRHPEWAGRVEKELSVAWPDYKMAWK